MLGAFARSASARSASHSWFRAHCFAFVVCCVLPGRLCWTVAVALLSPVPLPIKGLWDAAAIQLCSPCAAAIQLCSSDALQSYSLCCSYTTVWLRSCAALGCGCTAVQLRCSAILRSVLQLYNPAPLPIEGLRACCSPVLQLLSSSISAATLTPQLLLPSWCCCALAATHCSQPLPRYQSRG